MAAEEDEMDVCDGGKNEENNEIIHDDDDDVGETSASSSTVVTSSSNENGKSKKKKRKKKKKKKAEKTNGEVDDGGETSQSMNEEPQVYLPGTPMEDGEELTFDSSAYKMYHQVQCGAPCLSFDVISDSLGDNRADASSPHICSHAKKLALTGSLYKTLLQSLDDCTWKKAAMGYIIAPSLAASIQAFQVKEAVVNMSKQSTFPMTMYLAAGTQSASGQQNFLIVMKMSDLQEMEEELSDNEDIIEEQPELAMEQIRHSGAINRVRYAHIPGRQVVSTWSETGKVHIWDISQQFIHVENDNSAMKTIQNHKPLYTFTGHQTEGFAMDWSRTVSGRLLTGDCNKNIHLWNPTEEGSWRVDQRPYSSHTQSVEDLQWSPNEATVFASCSVDKTVKVWDIRAAPSKACMLTAHAHDADVNVISWNRNEPLLVSGGDDGVIKVWDLRQFQNGEPVAVFKHHTDAITSVEWLPTDNSVFAASGSDNQITLWDLAVERDEEQAEQGKAVDVPPQMLFIHMGQKDIKELHWHAQIPGVVVSTAEDGFNVFKTISV